jgi:hypothetical protein
MCTVDAHFQRGITRVLVDGVQAIGFAQQSGLQGIIILAVGVIKTAGQINL